MRKLTRSTRIAAALATAFVTGGAPQVSAAAVDGSELPFPPVPSASKAGPTLQTSVHHRRAQPNHLAKDAPNVLIILIDDVGYGQASTYGGEINTPNLTRIAQSGISYNAFHNTSISSPTRAALLTGRNHQRVGSGTIAERAVDWDGYTGVIPKTSATDRRSAEKLRLQDRRFRQMAQHAGRPDDGDGAFRQVADRLWLRVFLRLPGRRNQPVGTAPGGKHQHHRTAQHAGLSRHRRPGRSRHRLAEEARSPTRPTSPSSCTSRPAAGMARTMSHRHGRPSTRTSSTMATRRCASASSSARRNPAGCRRPPN